MRKLFKLLAFIIIIAFLIYNLPKFIQGFFPTYYSEHVDIYSEKYGVEKSLVYAIIKAESNFKPDAVSKKGAKGLMQLMEDTAAWCGERLGYGTPNLFDPGTSIEMGTFYLRYLLDMYRGNEKTALAAYNAGHGNVDRWLSDDKYSKDGLTLDTIPYKETEKYVNKIMSYKKVYNYIVKRHLFGFN